MAFTSISKQKRNNMAQLNKKQLKALTIGCNLSIKAFYTGSTEKSDMGSFAVTAVYTNERGDTVVKGIYSYSRYKTKTKFTLNKAFNKAGVQTLYPSRSKVQRFYELN